MSGLACGGDRCGARDQVFSPIFLPLGLRRLITSRPSEPWSREEENEKRMQKSTLVCAVVIAMTAITAHAAVLTVEGTTKSGITLSDDGVANKLPTMSI